MKTCLKLLLFTLLICSFSFAKKHPDPYITLPLIPDTAQPGVQGFTLTVNGDGFEPNSVVRWNDKARPTQFISGNTLKATINASDVKQPGTAWVSVITPGPPKRLLSNAAYFTIRDEFSTVATSFRTPFNAIGPLATGDFNGDGKLDVAIAQPNQDGTGTIQIFLGNGDGTFQAPVNTTLGYVPVALFAADLTNDGMTDLAVLYEYQSQWAGTLIYISTGGGNLQSAAFMAAFPVAAVDLNNDGKVDLIAEAVANGGNYFVAYETYLGNGDGTFYTQQVGIGAYQIGRNVAVGDLNGDGKLDFVAAIYQDAYVFLGNGDGTFPASGVSYALQYGGDFASLADVNGDGKLDILTDGVSVLLGQGDGTFVSNGGIPTSGSGIAVGDFNGDGKLDIVTPVIGGNYPYTQSLDTLLGNGDGTFQNAISIPTGFCCTGNPGFGWGDFDGDGLMDVIVQPASTYTTPVSPVLMLQTVASASPNILNFGYQNLNVPTAPQLITITNIGKSYLPMQGVMISGTAASDYSQKSDCDHKVPPGGTCKVRVVFTPTQQGTRSATLVVNYKGAGAPQEIPLSGSGESLSVSLTPSTLTFPAQLLGTLSHAEVAMLTNVGSYQIAISKIFSTAHFPEINNCPTILYVNYSCQISVRFRPGEKGDTKGTLTVSMANGVPKQTVALSGAGTVVKLSAEGINFGNEKVGGSTAPVPVKVTNTANQPLSISGIGIVGTNQGDFLQINNCGTGVPAHGSCTVHVVFSPVATGQRSSTLQINDDGGGSPQTVTLTGTGT